MKVDRLPSFFGGTSEKLAFGGDSLDLKRLTQDRQTQSRHTPKASCLNIIYLASFGKGFDMPVTKRFSAPKFWNMRRKETKYAVTPAAGPHNKENCIPIGIVLRDLLGHARNMGEARKILATGAVKVNNVARKEYNFPAGLMDVVDVGGDVYRVMPSKKGLSLASVQDGQLKLAKVMGKTTLRGGKTQLNFHDGTNMIVEKDSYKTSDVLAIDTAHNTVKDAVKFENGALAVVTGGHNAGLSGRIEHIDKALETVTLSAGEAKIPVPIRYIFVVGRGAPLVNIG